MNAKLQALLDWANENDINLNRVELDFGYERYDYDKHCNVPVASLRFWHNRENHKNIINLKRAVDFLPDGKPPISALKAVLQLSFGEVIIRYEGAMVCKPLGYDCQPAEWNEEQIDEKV